MHNLKWNSTSPYIQSSSSTPTNLPLPELTRCLVKRGFQGTPPPPPNAKGHIILIVQHGFHDTPPPPPPMR